MSALLERLTGIDDIAATIREHPRIGTMLIAYTVNQFAEPIRIAGLMYILPRIVHLTERKI